MKTKSILSLALLGVFAACSSQEDEPALNNGRTINFSVAVPKAPRAAATTTATIRQFTVYAFTDGKEYMSNVKVLRNGDSWTYHPTVYWPETPVNFFAYSPDISSSVDVDGSGIEDISGFTNDGTVDLLYAVNMNETAKAAPVNINFRHALSKVSVLLSSVNQALTVKVHYVLLHDIYQQGAFNFPKKTTSVDSPDIVGSWLKLGLRGDVLTFLILDQSGIATLTPMPTDLTEGHLDYSFFIPQPLDKLAYDGIRYTGNCIEVDCEIFDAATGAKIWPTPSTPASQLVAQTNVGRLMYPLTTETLDEWKPGHAYIYNIKIDNPAELQPINFNVSVDEYILEQ